MKLQWALGLVLPGLITAHKLSHERAEALRAKDTELDSAFIDQSPPYLGKLLPRDDWRVTCDSVAAGFECQKAIDSNSDSFWITDCSPITHAPLPHHVTVDLGSTENVSAIAMQPRQDGESDGWIAAHRVFLSTDGETWGEPVAYGTWPSEQRHKLSIFEPRAAQFVRLVADSEANGGRSTSIAELYVFATNYTIPTDPARGAWGPTIDTPVVAVSGANDPNGNLILWSSWAEKQFHSSPGAQTATAIWNVTDKSVSQRLVTNTYHDMFCPGISMDGNGDIVVTGGNDAAQTSIYHPANSSWIEGPAMNIRRGYQASTTTSDGRVFTIGGSWSGGSNRLKDGEIYDPFKATWEKLSETKVKPMLTRDREGRWRADNHAWLFGWKGQTVFQAGPSKQMNWYDVKGEKGSTTSAGTRADDNDSMSGNAVMFDAVEGKILTFGGSPNYDESYATNHAHIITLGEPMQNPHVVVAGKNSEHGSSGMHDKRTFHTSVVLPDGSVFIAGGQSFGIAFDQHNMSFTPEIYYPQSDKFVKLQTNNIIRVYHTLSLLLPDATVLNGGGGLCGNCTANHYDAQVFTPPYLLTKSGDLATRPVIKDLSTHEVTVGDKIKINTDSAITSASLIRLGSATHTVNTDQRRVPLNLEISKDFKYRYQVTVPGDPGIVIPGYWMLFVMNEEGVPSVSKTIKVRVDSVGSACVDEDEDEDEDEDVSMSPEASLKFLENLKSALVVQS